MNQLLITGSVLVAMLLAAPVMAGDYPEFGGRCAMGVAMGTEVKTDCSVTWQGPADDQFCFGNEQAKKDFHESLDENMQKAFDNYPEVVMQKG